MSMYKWSQTAASNSNADPSINWAEGQAPSSVNDSARALMAAVAKYRDDVSGALNTTGILTAYAVATSEVYASLLDGINVTCRMHVASGAAPTLAVDGLAAKAIRIATSTAIPTGAMAIGSLQKFVYDLVDDCFYVAGYFTPTTNLIAPATTAIVFAQTAAPTGWTKSTTHNDKALRVVSGAASSGGTVDFSTAFASKTVAGTVGGTAITEANLPSHTHLLMNGDSDASFNTPDANNFLTQIGGTATGSNTQRYILAASATTPDRGKSGATGSGSTHTHSFTGTAIDLAVKYVDTIIATKD